MTQYLKAACAEPTFLWIVNVFSQAMQDVGRARKAFGKSLDTRHTVTLSTDQHPLSTPVASSCANVLIVGILTSLADAYGCRIEINSNTTLAKPQYSQQPTRTVYSCTPGSSSTQFEVHVLSVYEGNRHTRPPSAGDTRVNIVSGGQSSRPIILVLASYEPVNWILNLPAGITISRVILVSTKKPF